MSPSSSTPAKILVACASFKGTLSSQQAGDALARGLRSAGFTAQVVALADGGEGLVDCLSEQVAGALRVGAPARCPLLTPRTATFALLPRSGGRPGMVAVIEMAASSGLPLVPADKRDPKIASTAGVGDQILGVLEHQSGELEILLGIGGSATNDGGAGMAEALGVKLLDKSGQPLEPGGAALINLARIDISAMNPRLKQIPVTVACDVNNPLCGPNGASAIYGPQKGATAEDVKLLDAALANYANIIERDLGKKVANIPGAGAAGGLGAGCLAFLNATLKPGIELVLDALDFDKQLEGAALVITGEGKLDDQTLMGKAPSGVAARAKKKGIRCVAVGGGIDAAHEGALKKTFAAIESLSVFAGSSEVAMREGAAYLEKLAASRAQSWLA